LPAGEVSLEELIAGDPQRYLGEQAAKKYGALPFLFKLLAAEKPLSIQAHPDLVQARDGFSRENLAGLPIDDPRRSYKDSNHKPEIICALTPFTGMCGFRSPGEILRLLNAFLSTPASVPSVIRNGLAPLIQVLKLPVYSSETDVSVMRKFLKGLFSLSRPVREALTEYILVKEHAGLSDACEADACEWEIMRSFARQYPGDPAVIAPLYLNVFRLEGGEAVLLNAGVLHAYIHGFGVELMSNSDNVLRGGLTSKHIDVPELMKVLDINPGKPQIVKPDQDFFYFTYPSPCDEFSLSVIKGSGEMKTWPLKSIQRGPSICLVTQGEVCMEDTVLKRGESVFIPPISGRETQFTIRGNYTIYVASLPYNENFN
jgi:mannose-6-phosphate isomerase